jgi:hypothetical protein
LVAQLPRRKPDHRPLPKPEIALYPEFKTLRDTWEERLVTFEGIFKKFLLNPNP